VYFQVLRVILTNNDYLLNRT